MIGVGWGKGLFQTARAFLSTAVPPVWLTLHQKDEQGLSDLLHRLFRCPAPRFDTDAMLVRKRLRPSDRVL